MKYTVRNLCSRDIFPMSKIISKIGFSRLKECFESDSMKDMINTKNAESVGIAFAIEIAGILLENLSLCEQEIYSFLSDITGESVDDLKSDSMSDFAELIFSVVKKDEFSDFISVVSRLIK